MHKILIANRGLPALKFILSIREWLNESPNNDVKLFGFVTPVDISSKYKYITLLDQTIYTDNDSIYTNIDEIVKYCKDYNIDSLFPGWGYLSENEHFVKALTDNGIQFLGPTYENMCAIGNKISCNDVAERLCVPVLPWSGDKQLNTIEEIEHWCDKIGYPVMLKAGNSGGGKGIRIVRNKSKCYEMWQEILQEVVDPMIYATKYIENASHLEIQILGDGAKSIHLHGRDCSTQRRNQKLIEECPIQKCPILVNNIQKYAEKITNYIGYRGLATVEFIYDQDTKDVYILEVNPRIQVEHIITEQLFGINLIKMLFLVATGTKLSDIPELQNLNYDFKTHIISMRINAENPYEDFRPTLGQVHEVDITYNRKSWGYFSVANDGQISETVDSQFGHISAFGSNRESAIRNLTNLIDGLKIRGTIYNTASFLKNFINRDVFRANRHTTRYLNNVANTQIFNTKYNMNNVAILGILYNCILLSEPRIKECLDGLQRGHNYFLKELNQFQKTILISNDTLYEYEFIVEINSGKSRRFVIRYNDVCHLFTVTYDNGRMNLILNKDYIYTVAHSYHDEYKMELLINQHKYNFIRKIKDNKIRSPASGKVIECVFSNGSEVNEGDVYIKIECMKMILPFKADKSGQIVYSVKQGDVVVSNQLIGEFSGNIVAYEYATNPQLLNEIPIEPNPNRIIEQNNTLLNRGTHKIQPKDDALSIPLLFAIAHTTMFPELICDQVGSRGYLMDNKFVLLVNNVSANNGVFSYTEDNYYFMCLRYARENKMPFVFVASNSGAEIRINDSVKFALRPRIENGELQYMFLEPDEYEQYKADIIGKFIPEHNHYEITCVNNPGVINLDGSALLVSEMAKARNEIQTITLVLDRTVGVGAYLARLSERIVQRRDSAILLTGYQSINKVLGRDLYESNIQLGGHLVMANNGISHKIVDTTVEGVEYIKQLLRLTTSNEYLQSKIDIPSMIHEIIDRDTLLETMESYARNVVTGRCSIGGKTYGIAYATNYIADKFAPCDPADLSSSTRTEKMSPNILYPDTSYKISKTIRDCNVENIPILIVADWRGFSGGTRDMFDNVLDFGSMIVSELAYYKNDVTIYIPPNGQLRGGSMVVFSKSINREKIKLYAAPTAKINVLEPSATKELKYKATDKQKYATIHNINDKALMESISNRIVELNDVINPEYKVLNQYESIVDAIVEPGELRLQLL